MNKKNTDYLFKTYSELFKNRDNLKLSLMAFGFECGNGWFSLIKDLCNDIKKWFIENRDGVPDDFEVHQVKEKFGGLRFYISPAPQEILDMIHKAESDSYFICERCGDDIRKHVFDDDSYHSYFRDELSWIQTLCDKCLKKEIKRVKLKDGDYISDWQKKHKAPFIERQTYGLV